MTPERWNEVKSVFAAAMELDSAARRPFVESRCAGDAGVMAEVLRLLDAGEAATDEHSPVGATSDAGPRGAEAPASRRIERSPFLRASDRIGSYKVLKVLGEGGMGIVYLAEQERPRRTVALKMIRPGVATPAMLRRFEHEAQVLGRLQHAGIAQIFEAGTANLGSGPQPYFAMEFIRGKPLVEYAQEKGLGTRERLELFARICDAVQHAHQKGVIHRDLKPGNILVDEAGQPKILDFGVARAIDADIQATTIQTDIGQLVGTLPYMSPEQAAGRVEDLDTRSDVYSLGVVLYELLAGRPPYLLKDKMIHEAVRVIQEEEPTRLSSISRVFRGDIETIAGKALEKERTRRYQSAGDLGSDVRRYLSDEPIVARPPSVGYQLGKFARRNKGLVGGTLAVFAVLVAGVIGTTSEMLRAQDAEARATDAAGREHAQLQLTRKEAAKAEAVREFLQEIFGSGDPVTSLGPGTTILEALEKAAARLEDGSLHQQPEIEAAVRDTLGVTFQNMGRYDAAEPQFRAALDLKRRAYGPEHVETRHTECNLGILLRYTGRLDESGPMIRAAVAAIRAHYGDRHLNAIMAINDLAYQLSGEGKADEAITYFALSVDLADEMGIRTHDTVVWLNNLAAQFKDAGRGAEAEPLARRALEISREVHGEHHATTYYTLNILAAALEYQGKYAEAEACYREAIDGGRAITGPNLVVAWMSNLANLLRGQNRLDEAEPLAREALGMQVGLCGQDHADTIMLTNNLALILQFQGKLDEAEPLLRRAMESGERLLGPEHPNQLIWVNNYARLLQERGNLDAAEPLLARISEVSARTLSEQDYRRGVMRRNHGLCLAQMKRYEQAEAPLLEAHRLLSAAVGESHALTVKAAAGLADLYEAWGKPDQATVWRDKLPSQETPAPAK